MKALATALQHNSTLLNLDLSWNNIGDSAACGLATALQHNSTLTALDLRFTNIGDKALLKRIDEKLDLNKCTPKRLVIARASEAGIHPAPQQQTDLESVK